jgi:hypothetical protein
VGAAGPGGFGGGGGGGNYDPFFGGGGGGGGGYSGGGGGANEEGGAGGGGGSFVTGSGTTFESSILAEAGDGSVTICVSAAVAAVPAVAPRGLMILAAALAVGGHLALRQRAARPETRR